MDQVRVYGLKLIRDTEKAFGVCLEEATTSIIDFWLPKSLVEYEKEPEECFNMPKWLAMKHKLDYE